MHTNRREGTGEGEGIIDFRISLWPKSITSVKKGRKAMKARIFFAVWLTAVFSLTSLSFAEVPQMINYQGVLTRSDGEPLDTTISMTFGLYEDSTTLSDLWTETQDSVEVEDGILSVLLGSVNPIPATVFDGSLRYLGIQVGTDDEMSPRRALVSVGNAFHSEFADLAEYAVNPDSDWVVRGDTVYHIGSVGIGMEDPAEKLDVEGNIHASGSIFSGNSIGIETGDAFGPDRLVTDGPVIYVDQEFPWGPNTFTGDIKVGIGDDDPDAFLEVSANAGVPPGRALLMLSSDDATDGDLVVVKDDGDVGIGTPNPSQKLDVDGKIEVGDDATAATAGAIRWSGTNFEGYDGSLWNALDVQSTTGGGWTDDGTVVRLTTSTDSVGIGTTTPNQKLVISEGKVGIGYNQAGQTAALAINGNVASGRQAPVRS